MVLGSFRCGEGTQLNTGHIIPACFFSPTAGTRSGWQTLGHEPRLGAGIRRSLIMTWVGRALLDGVHSTHTESDRWACWPRRGQGTGEAQARSGGTSTPGFRPCSLLGQDPTLWTWPPVLQIFLFPFQDSLGPCFFSLLWSRFSLTLLCLSFLLLEPWRSGPSASPSPSTLPGP